MYFVNSNYYFLPFCILHDMFIPRYPTFLSSAIFRDTPCNGTLYGTLCATGYLFYLVSCNNNSGRIEFLTSYNARRK